MRFDRVRLFTNGRKMVAKLQNTPQRKLLRIATQYATRLERTLGSKVEKIIIGDYRLATRTLYAC